MSKRNQKDFKYTAKNTLPKLGSVKTNWDLKKFFYTSENDPQIEKDVAIGEKSLKVFAHKYANKNFAQNRKMLLSALKDYEKLLHTKELSKPLYYFSYRQSLNSGDSKAEKNINRISARMTKASNLILFFDLEIGKISKAEQKEILKDTDFKPYEYYLSTIFENAKHMLTESEERIMNLRNDTSSSMWVSGTEKILGNRKISVDGTTLPLNEAIELLPTYTKTQRTKVWRVITKELEAIAEVAENEFNAIITHKKISDELRSFSKPYSATVLSYENNAESIEALVSSISKKGFKLSRDFYSYKAKLQGVKKIAYENKYDPLAPAPEMSFETAVEICRDAFYGLSSTYGELFDGMLKNGQVDVYPHQGKRGGAFMSGSVNLPTFVFLNHVNTFKSLETLAHEMGHAIHGERSKAQSVLYEDFSTTTAETASTFFENLVFRALYKEASPKDKIILLHDKILGDIATIQRQIAFFNFELDLHNQVRKEGAITKEELRDLMQKHMISYLGKNVEVRKEDGYSFVYVSHFRAEFYVYTYAYGLLMSSLMHVRLDNDPTYAKQIDAFLTSGGRAPVETIFKDIGIDPLRIETFNEALELQQKDISEFKRLTKGLKRF